MTAQGTRLNGKKLSKRKLFKSDTNVRKWLKAERWGGRAVDLTN